MAVQEPVFLELLLVALCGWCVPTMCVTCPKECDCGQSFTKINCSTRGMTDVPRGIYENTSELLLKNNTIESLRRDQFLRLRHLERLDLGENTIMTIQEGAFNGLYRLQILNLQRNRLRSLQGPMFRYLTNLRELTLQGNPIICLEAYTFSHLPSLRKLDLWELRQLKAISRNAFNGLTALVSLSLSDSNLRRLPYLQHLTSLQDLDVSRNSISVLNADNLQGLVKLTRLLLSHNHLSSVEQDAFDDLYTLSELDLSYNNLTSLPFRLFRDTSLRKVNLYRNPWNCTCVVKWLAKWMRERMRNETTLLQSHRCGGCFTPSELRNRALCDVPLTSFKCKPPRIQKVQPTVNATLGGNAALQCQLSPGIETAISWIAPDGTKAKPSSFRGRRVKALNDGTLNISRVTMADAGVYRCIATNDDGFDNFYKILNVTGSILPEFAATQVPINLDELPDVDDFDASYCTGPRNEEVFLLNGTQQPLGDGWPINPTVDATKIAPIDLPTQKENVDDTFMTLYKGYLIAALVAAVSLGTLLWILVCAVMKCSKDRNRDDRKNKRLCKLKKEESTESRFNVSCVKSIDPEETVEIPDVYTVSKLTGIFEDMTVNPATETIV